MALTNSQFASQLATLLSLNTTQAGQLDTMVNDWDPTTPADLAQLVVDFVGASTTRDTQYNDWAVGTATGGPNNDGYYPVTVLGGGTVSLPSPAKLTQQIAKGDPGHDAKMDLGVSFIGPYANGEVLGKFVAAYPMTFVAANSRADATAPTGGSAVVTVNKRSGGVTTAFATITFAANQTTGAVAFAAGATASMAAGDVLIFVAPNPANATFADLTSTFAGS